MGEVKISKYSRNCAKRPLSKIPALGFNTNHRLMQVKSIAECSKWSILQYFRPSLSYQYQHLCFSSIFEWPFYAGVTVLLNLETQCNPTQF